MFKRIFVPTDGSALSRRAVKRAVQLAKEQNASVVGFHVAPPWLPGIYEDTVAVATITEKQHAEAMKKVSSRYLAVVQKAAAAAGVPCKTDYALHDAPYLALISAARSNRCDLIVMASHGRRGLSRLLLGSETSKVLAHTTIPVLVQR
jgi:nucleotide-binding universal stress UspA family protein